MAGLPPGDPQLVSMIVNHLKTQGLFDQFRRECLADVDTKPAYLNLKQRVDNFVSNHLSNHTWSPHLNKNQLRNNIRQLVLQSGMLEQGVDRIVAQVVDPKINHNFRPQVERVVQQFLSPGSCSEEPPAPLPPVEVKPDSSIPEQATSSAPTTTTRSDAMSILETITSLNQEASVRASSSGDRGRRAFDEPMQLDEEGEQDMSIVEEGEDLHDGRILEEAEESKLVSEVQALDMKMEEPQDEIELGKERHTEEIKMEEEDVGAQDLVEEEKLPTKTAIKHSEEKQDEDLLKSTSQAKQKARERIKEEYSLEDSDLDGLSDITVSSVHTSDLSSFEEESDAEEQPSDSSEEGELTTDGEKSDKREASGDTGEEDKESKPRRKAYVHKPFLYSRYYSDSDDEITVEERRRSAAKDKEERLLKRQQNRERMEEKRKQKAAQTEEQDQKKLKSGDASGLERPRAIEARKERKVLEKKMALNRKRKLDSRKEDVSSKKKGDTGEGSKKANQEVKSVPSRMPQQKLMRNLSESASSEERHRRMSGSISEDSNDTKKLCDKGRTHSFILELEQGAQEALKQRSIGKFDRVSRKDFHPKDRKDKERSIVDERAKLKQKQEKKPEHQADESQQKVTSEEKGEKKPKLKSEKKIAGTTKDQKAPVCESVTEEGSKDAKKPKPSSVETAKVEKDKEREKDKTREKDKDKDKIKEKEKVKGEKASGKIEPKQLLRPDSAGSSEDRSDMELGIDGSKRKEKHSKELLKRSKSHTEDRQGDKPKPKVEGNEKDKFKSDHENPKPSKSATELDKDPKKAKPIEKGKMPEKSKSKTPQLTKTEKKPASIDVRAAIGATEAAKEKRKEGSVKEQRKPSEDPQHDNRCEMKSPKRKMEKKDKGKKDVSQEERKAPKEAERPDKLPKSPLSSPRSDADEQQRKPLTPLQDTSMDSEPAAATAASFSDDTCDALSDITPEPSEGEAETPAVPVEADALLTLMDVCAAADTRLPVESVPEAAVAPETALRDADMKMQEAALTLLSMDPDSAVSSSFISAEPEVVAPVYVETPMPTAVEAAAEEEVQQPPTDVHMAAEPSPDVPQPSAEPTVQEASSAVEEPETPQSEMAIKATGFIVPQEADSTSSECPVPSNEEEAAAVEIAMETQPEEEPAPQADTDAAVVFEAPEVKEDREEAAAAFLVLAAEQAPTASDAQPADISSADATEISSEQVQTEPDVVDPEVCPEMEEVPVEDTQAKTDMVNVEDEIKNDKELNTSAEGMEPQSMETATAAPAAETTEIGESEPLSQSTLEKQPCNVSSSDSQDDEKLSDVSEKQEKPGRGRPKRKLSGQIVAGGKESGDDTDEKRIKRQPSGEEREEHQIVEIKSPRRGRSSKTSDEEEKDQAKQPEKLEETPSRRGRRSAARETSTDAQKSEESKDEMSTEKSPAENPENPQNVEEENGSKVSETEVNQASGPPTTLEDDDAEGGADSKDKTDTDLVTQDEAATEGSKLEEMGESAEESQAEEEEVNEGPGQQEQHEQQMDEDNHTDIPPSASQSEGQEDAKDESSSEKKPDNEEEEAEQQQGDQATTPKKPGRRGRPPKAVAAAAAAAAAAIEDSDKKSEEQNAEEDEDGGEEGKETATRATTRAASRLEAERNKPSKPSTRASRQNGKDETAAGTRGTRGQAAAAAAAVKGGRKREPSPPAVRTRGGQKSEEPPSKRAKR